MLELTPYTVHKFTIFTHKRTAGSYTVLHEQPQLQLVAYSSS